MRVFKQLFSLLTARERRLLYGLFGAVLLMAGLQVVSVASIMPFLSVAADPSSVHENYYLQWAYESFGFGSTRGFLIALGIGALISLVISNVFIVGTNWALLHYTWSRNHSLSLRLLRSYLYRPYEYFLDRNSSKLGKNILEEVKEVVTGMLLPGLRGAANGVVAVFIIGFLVVVDPVVAITVALILGVAYIGIYFFIRDRFDMYGEKRVDANTGRYQFVSEAFGGVKEVKLRGKEEAFLTQYASSSKEYAWNQAQYHFIKRAPRYGLEAVAFGGIILIAVYLIAIQENIQQVIPVLGLYAFAGYRLMPALQKAFKGFASARFNIAALKDLQKGMHETSEDTPVSEADHGMSRGESDSRLELEDKILVEGLEFSYSGANEAAIQDLTFEIPAYTTVGFVGKTGSGKTTVVDLILGLLQPQQGCISVDGMPLQGEALRRWRKNVGYVPQQIYLADDSVARNIAFGVREEDIDMDAVEDAVRRAHIYDFIRNGLPNQWETVVGERGVKLSGGQRQRIGIARALYHKPSVLVFDEATSALDQATEASVMEAIYELEDNRTMLMIAHRLSTVQRADNIIMLENGRKVGEGTYEDLKRHHESFQEMAFEGGINEGK